MYARKCGMCGGKCKECAAFLEPMPGNHFEKDKVLPRFRDHAKLRSPALSFLVSTWAPFSAALLGSSSGKCQGPLFPLYTCPPACRAPSSRVQTPHSVVPQNLAFKACFQAVTTLHEEGPCLLVALQLLTSTRAEKETPGEQMP